MKNIKFIAFILLFASVVIKAQLPEGAILNLKADAGIVLKGENVSEWQDISNSGIKAVQPDNNLQPVLIQNAINGQPIVRFNGTQYLEASSVFPVQSDYSLFFVVTLNSFGFTNCMVAGNGHAVYYNPPQVLHNDGNTQAISSKALTLNKPAIISVIYSENAKTAKMYIDGILTAESIVGSNYDPIIYLGAYYKNYFLCGDLAEVILYKKSLNDSEQKKAESYLFEKYLLEPSSDGTDDLTFTSLPANNQLFPRDEDNYGNVNIAGNFNQTKFTKILVKIFKNNSYLQTISQNLNFMSGIAPFNINFKIHAELSNYNIIIFASNSNQDSVLKARTNIVCGDVILINGQSNSITNNNPNTNKFIRTFGWNYSNSTADTLWEMADDWNLGYGPNIGAWGMTLGQLILENQKVPVCVINGGIGGTTIEQHLPYSGDRYNLNTIYGELLYRVEKSKLKNAAKVLFWYQGESNGVDNYKNNFISLVNSWLEDFPALKKIYTVQIHTGCGGGYSHRELREVQRQMPEIIKNIEIETNASSGLPGHDGCHYDYEGYRTLGEQLYRLYNKDFFGSTDTIAISSPNISEAFFINPNKDKLALVFKPKLTIMNLQNDTIVSGISASLRDYIYLSDSTKIKSLSSNNDTIFVELEKGSNAKSISYLPELYYNNSYVIYEGPWLYNQRNMGALSFYRFPITAKNMIDITDHTKELIKCAGTEDNYLYCHAETFNGLELRYEWYKDGERLPGENSPKLNFPNFDYIASGIYKCMVYISGGPEPVWTDDIPVYALTEPEITEQPKDNSDVQIEGTFKFEVKVQHKGKLLPNYQDSIQWYKFTAKTSELTALKNKGRFSGTNKLQLIITGLTSDDICQKDDYYFVEIISQCGKIRSNPFVIAIVPKITILETPKDIAICEGNNTEFKIDYEAKNCDTLTFQWFFNNKPITANENIELNKAFLKISNSTIKNSGKYFLEISSKPDNINAKSETIKLVINQKPQIVSQSPDSIIIDEGKNFELSVEAVSSDTINYQWFKDSVLLPGYNSKNIIKTNSEIKDAGVYYCEITNDCGMVKSKEIKLKINPINSVNEDFLSGYYISPNPATEYIVIQPSEASDIQIINTYGEIVLTVEQTSSLVQRIDISNLVPGMYFVKIGNRVEKFVKM